MKRKDKENLNFIKQALEPLNKHAELPQELGKNSIAALVAGNEQQAKKPNRKKLVRTLGSIAAAAAVALGLGLYLGRDLPAPEIQPPIDSGAQQQEYPHSGNSEQTIIDYFKKLSMQDSDSLLYDYKGNDFITYITDSGIANQSAPGSATGTNSLDNADHGTTNTQVAGIDEEDIIKNDGTYLYIATRNSIKIVEAKSMKLISKTEIEYANENEKGGIQGIYIKKNTLVAVCTKKLSATPTTYINVYDISNKATPMLTDKYEQEGYFFTSRMIGERIIVLSSYSEGCDCGGDETVLYKDVTPKIVHNGNQAVLEPQFITILPQENSYSSAYTVMTTVTLGSGKPSFKSSAVLGVSSDAYCTNESLYITHGFNKFVKEDGETMFSGYNTATKIHRYSFESGVFEHKASGEVLGTALNQFSLDEKDGYLRIATTNNGSFGAVNIITVLDKSLKTVATIDGIAPNETIKSVRYIGDYGYVVTFEQTDPLFVIDFKDMTAPKIVGELKIPGFSSYLHPFNGYLVGIGTNGDSQGTLSSLKISLFDISDPKNPKEIDRFIIENAYVESYHKSVMDCADKNILGFIYRDYNSHNADFCTLEIKEGKIKLLGSFSNSDKAQTGPQYSANSTGDMFYYTGESAAASILRGTYIGSTLYTVSETRICSFPLAGGECIAKLDF